MRARVNGIDLFFDVVGAQLAPEQDRVRERPSIVLMHGGPGMDHMVFRPALDRLSVHAQVIYIDHRACGRSQSGAEASWNLDQWADDLAELIRLLGIPRPIVLGTSFGGMVAQRFAARHPDRLSGLVLMCTAARAAVAETCEAMTALGGAEAGQVARRFFTDIEAPGAIENYLRTCLPLYSYRTPDPAVLARVQTNEKVMLHFLRPGGEFHTVDLFHDLQATTAPTLVIYGKNDPVRPRALAEELLEQLGVDRKQLVGLESCSHFAEQDAPEQIIAAIRQFFTLA